MQATARSQLALRPMQGSVLGWERYIGRAGQTFGPLAEVLADVLSRFVPEQRDLLHTSFALAGANRLEHMFASGDEFTASLRGLRDRACAPGSAVPSRPGGSIRS